MEGSLREIGHSVGLVVEALAILIVTIGTVEAVINIVRVVSTRGTNVEQRAVWLGLAHWLVAAMTFQLAGDIVATSFSPRWDEIGRLGAVASIRTFLSYFLDREVENTQKLQRRAEGRIDSSS